MGGGELGSNAPKSEPNIVPLTDILLVLLVIFMVVTPMIRQGRPVDLPEAVNTQDQGERESAITLYIEENDNVWLEDEQIDDLTKLPLMIEDLKESMGSEGGKEIKILLRADDEVKYGRVLDVMNEIKNAQIEGIGLVVHRSGSSE